MIRENQPRRLVVEDVEGDRAVFHWFKAPGVTLTIETTDGETAMVALTPADMAVIASWAQKLPRK